MDIWTGGHAHNCFVQRSERFETKLIFAFAHFRRKTVEYDDRCDAGHTHSSRRAIALFWLFLATSGCGATSCIRTNAGPTRGGCRPPPPPHPRHTLASECHAENMNPRVQFFFWRQTVAALGRPHRQDCFEKCHAGSFSANMMGDEGARSCAARRSTEAEGLGVSAAQGVDLQVPLNLRRRVTSRHPTPRPLPKCYLESNLNREMDSIVLRFVCCALFCFSGLHAAVHAAPRR